MVFTRHWAMPSADTFSIEPIRGFVQKYLMRSKVSIDPFARNSRLATLRNDLNPKTAAETHMDAEDFIREFAPSFKPDMFIFDPPYSINQIVTTYSEFGIDRDGKGTHNGALYSRVRQAIIDTAPQKSVVLSFGWNSAGMGKSHFDIEEILLVCHGGAHNDTICMAEVRKAEPLTLL